MPPTNLFGLGYGVGPAGYGYPSAGTVAAPPTLSYASPQSWTYGAAITPVSPTTTGATSFAVTAGALPTGVSLNTSTGEITGTPTAWAESGSVTIRATGAGGTADSTVNWTMAFVPATFGTCVLWLKADGTLWQDDGRTTPVTADGDPVGAWDDANGSNHFLQTTGTKRYTYKTSGGAAGLGGKGLLGDGVDDHLTRASLGLGSSYMLCFLYSKSGAGPKYIWSAGDNQALLQGYVGTEDIEFYGSTPRFTIKAAPGAGIHAVCVGGTAAGMTSRFDGAAGGTSGSAAPTSSSAQYTGPSSGAGMAGYLCEILAYSTYDATSLQRINDYLNARR